MNHPETDNPFQPISFNHYYKESEIKTLLQTSRQIGILEFKQPLKSSEVSILQLALTGVQFNNSSLLSIIPQRQLKWEQILSFTKTINVICLCFRLQPKSLREYKKYLLSLVKVPEKIICFKLSNLKVLKFQWRDLSSSQILSILNTPLIEQIHINDCPRVGVKGFHKTKFDYLKQFFCYRRSVNINANIISPMDYFSRVKTSEVRFSLQFAFEKWNLPRKGELQIFSQDFRISAKLLPSAYFNTMYFYQDEIYLLEKRIQQQRVPVETIPCLEKELRYLNRFVQSLPRKKKDYIDYFQR